MSKDEDKVIIWVNQELSKPDELVLLMSTFQVRYNGTRVDTAPMQSDPRYQFGIVLKKRGR